MMGIMKFMKLTSVRKMEYDGYVGTHNMRPPEMRMESRKDTSVCTKQNIELGWPRGQDGHLKNLVV